MADPTTATPHGAHGHAHDHGHAHHHHAPAPHDERALISARGLSLTRNETPILEAVDLDISASEIVTLIGPNGAGKTSLVRVLLGLEKPDAGTIRRRDGLVIGYVPQRFDLDRTIPLTVERFMMLGQRAKVGEIEAALASVGAATTRERQVTQLSGGEMQRVLLARALLRNPSLLVLDEPVRGVDYAGEAELYGLIGRIRIERNVAILLVSHDLHVVMAQSDRVVCINRHVCCQGVPEAVARTAEYTRLFGPDAARAFAIYRHSHDHAHDLSGATQPIVSTSEPSRRP